MTEYKQPEVKEIEQNVHLLTFEDGKKLYLIGTAHVSQSSIELVHRIVDEVKPDTICIELDEKRFKAIRKKNIYVGFRGTYFLVV